MNVDADNLSALDGFIQSFKGPSLQGDPRRKAEPNMFVASRKEAGPISIEAISPHSLFLLLLTVQKL
jgi:hypothetical protein